MKRVYAKFGMRTKWVILGVEIQPLGCNSQHTEALERCNQYIIHRTTLSLSLSPRFQKTSLHLHVCEGYALIWNYHAGPHRDIEPSASAETTRTVLVSLRYFQNHSAKVEHSREEDLRHNGNARNSTLDSLISKWIWPIYGSWLLNIHLRSNGNMPWQWSSGSLKGAAMGFISFHVRLWMHSHFIDTSYQNLSFQSLSKIFLRK